MTSEALRPGPITGSGPRVRMLQRSIVATRMSNAASVAASLLRIISTHDVDPDRLQAQRARAREFVSLIRELENADESQMFEHSQLVPSEMWEDVAGDLKIPDSLADSLTKLLDSIDDHTFAADELARQAIVLNELAGRLQADGRNNLTSARQSSRQTIEGRHAL